MTKLAQIAKAHGKTVDGLVAAMVAPLKARLAKAVENDRLTKQRADALLDRITDLCRRAAEPKPPHPALGTEPTSD